MEGEWVVFSCKDTGPGLKRRNQPNSSVNSTSALTHPLVARPNGLGLYLVNTYQKAMNGKVEFISGDDKGVTVSLIFKNSITPLLAIFWRRHQQKADL
jgi:sensor histidine kinase regulating citrate/malate metabolism